MNANRAATLFQSKAILAAQKAIDLEIARVWRSLVQNDPAQLNVDYVEFCGPTHDKGEEGRVVRVSIDIESARVYNWMVLERSATDYHKRYWKRITRDPDEDARDEALREHYKSRATSMKQALENWNVDDVPFEIRSGGRL